MPVIQLPMSTVPSWDLGTVAKSPLQALNKEYWQGMRGYWSASASGSEGVFDISPTKNHAVNSGMVWGGSRFGRVITGTNNGTQHMPLLGITTLSSTPCTIWAHKQLDANNSYVMCEDGLTSYGLQLDTTGLAIRASAHLEATAAVIGTDWVQILIAVDASGFVTYYKNGVIIGADAGMTGTFNVQNLISAPVGDYAISGKFRACGIWNFKFTDEMIDSLNGDPYAVERKEEYITVRGTGGASSGSRVGGPMARPFAGPFGGPL